MIMGLAQRRARSFYNQDPLAVQRKLFQDLLLQGASTSFGRDYNLACIANCPFEAAYQYYRTHIPIRTYQQYWTDYFCTQSNGKVINLRDVTWPGQIKLFCETSGTTAPTKYIPFSDQMFLENRRAGLDLISCYIDAHPESNILNGKILYMSGSTDLTKMEYGIFSGDMSAITLRFRPWYLRAFVEPSSNISSLPWEDKLQAMAELLIHDKYIYAISGVPPWILLLLKRCLEISGCDVLQDVLPNLECIIHGGTSIKPYQAEFEKMFGISQPNYLEVLPSSEAFMGFQCAGDLSMRLTPYYGVFYEFVRFEDLDESGVPEPFASCVPLEQVEIGQRYAIILNTCSGLWRYHIGDTIRFTSLSPHFIEFTGRDRFLDKLEEKVTQSEVEQAVCVLNTSGNYDLGEFMVGTDVMARRHVWVLDVRTFRSDAEEAATILDKTLERLNADYATFRGQGRINFPKVILVPEGTIYGWSSSIRGKLGGQSKIPHIDPTIDSSMISSLLEYARKFAP